jgi:hypothetical protein
VDLWVARHLLSQGTTAARIHAILRLASPHFPRRHGDPEDYLRRTIARAATTWTNGLNFVRSHAAATVIIPFNPATHHSSRFS